MFVDEDNLPELLDMKPDFVIDAIDSLNAKCCLIEELCRRGIPFVSSMGAALKTDPSCIKTARLNQTKNCGLSRLLRRRLKRRGVDLQSVRCVYSDEQAVLPGGGICPAEEKGTRNILGSLPTITAIFGLTVANEAIKQLSGYKSSNNRKVKRCLKPRLSLYVCTLPCSGGSMPANQAF